MDEIAIVKRRSYIWPVLAILLLMIAVLVALWVMGYLGPTPEELNAAVSDQLPVASCQLSVATCQLPETARATGHY